MKVRIDRIQAEADRVLSLSLVSVDGSTLPQWEPGAHIMVHLPGEISRQYSLCSDPQDTTRWRIAVLRELESRGGSAAVHEQLKEADEIHIEGPLSNFRYEPGVLPEGRNAGGVLFIAGGIGVTPILPMVHAAEAAGDNWQLLYLGRNRAAVAFLDEVAGYGDRVRFHESDTQGLLDLPEAIAATGLREPQIYACGPAPLLDAMTELVPADRLHMERFTSDAANPQEGDQAFIVETSDGTEIEVGADETILAALFRHEIPILNSCQEGTCGTCETVVLDGEPEHRDHVLSDEEKDSNEVMMVCVSRCRGERLVLDL